MLLLSPLTSSAVLAARALVARRAVVEIADAFLLVLRVSEIGSSAIARTVRAPKASWWMSSFGMPHASSAGSTLAIIDGGPHT
jgi:hypothetical protein